MIEKSDLTDITKMILTVQKERMSEMMSEMTKMFLTIEKEHFKENELWICKGRRLQMTNIVNHMKICLKSIDKDRDRGVTDSSVLETTIGSIKSLGRNSGWAGPSINPITRTRIPNTPICSKDVWR